MQEPAGRDIRDLSLVMVLSRGKVLEKGGNIHNTNTEN
jgi:hypothetical protein